MDRPLYALILAGGSGERFWPLSRQKRPKQLLALFSEVTLIEATLARLEGLVPRENILILTNAEQESAMRALLGSFPAENILSEPAKRDTAAAIALGVGWIASRSPDATMLVLPADHVIRDQAGFQGTLRAAVSAANHDGLLVTVGIEPTWACPGFGYIEQGAPVDSAAVAGSPKEVGSPKVFEVARFREKPSVELAESFLSQGNFLWNAGMFIWTVPSITGAFREHVPVLAEFVDAVRTCTDLGGFLKGAFPALPKISIDYAVLEKAKRVWVVEAGFDWDDVGSWTAMAKYLEETGLGNCGNVPLKTIDASHNLVYSSQKSLVGLLGVSDLIVVQTEDALLICHRNDAERIKHLVAQVPASLQ
jgi:mannose-1-phosphate guanylyltransferase